MIQVDFEQLESIIAHLRAQGTDDAEVEVKRSGQRLSSDIWESVSAFANTAGGIIILGLSEPEGFTAAKGFDLQANLDDFISGVGDGERTTVSWRIHQNIPSSVMSSKVVPCW